MLSSPINARQIKAARALLEWSQEDLARASGLSIATIRNVESGQLSPRDATMAAVIRALSEANIIFTEDEGVRRKNNILSVIEGDDTFLRLLEDAFLTLKNSDHFKEILIWYGDDKVSPPAVVDAQQRFRKHGINIRFIAETGDSFLYFPVSIYRWVPKQYFRNTVITIYANKVALNIYPNLKTQQELQIIVIDNQCLSEVMRNAFNFMWDHCEIPTHSTSPTQYE